MAGSEEYQVSGPTATEEFQAQYTDCHTHGSETLVYTSVTCKLSTNMLSYCVDDAGEDVKVLMDVAEGAADTHSDSDSGSSGEAAPSAGEKNCHFHAGVEHCVGEGEEESAAGEKDCHFHAGVEHCVGGDAEESNCDATQRDYNIGLRVGLLFVILVTSAIGVFTPVLTRKFNLVGDNSIIFVVLKQFGTGIVISTAFIHLFTHAELMFANRCLGELKYEGTTAAIFMVGIFLSFLIDYLGARFVQWRQGKQVGRNTEGLVVRSDEKSSNTSASAIPDPESNHSHAIPHSHGPMRAMTPMEAKINVLNLEAGIIFHSIRKSTCRYKLEFS